MTTPERLADDHNSNRKPRHHKQHNKALLQVQQQFLNLQLQHAEVEHKRYMSIEREKVKYCRFSGCPRSLSHPVLAILLLLLTCCPSNCAGAV